jgi:2'-5' RNA ligase
VDSWPDWQNPYVHGTFVLWPPDDVRHTVNALRGRYDPVSQAICPTHITLTEPLHRQPRPDEWYQLRQIVAASAPFELTYRPLRSFLPYPCIWFEIQPAEPVLSLRTALHRMGLVNLDLPHTDGFIPHMTITEGLSGPEVNEALLAALQEQVAGGTFAVSDVAFIAPDADFRVTVGKRLPLGGAGGR